MAAYRTREIDALSMSVCVSDLSLYENCVCICGSMRDASKVDCDVGIIGIPYVSGKSGGPKRKGNRSGIKQPVRD